MSQLINNSGSELSRIKENTELAIDKMGIESFLELVETICSEKAEHIATNWQDAGLARCWTKVAGSIHLAAIAGRHL